MTDDLQQAKQLLADSDCTCVICKDNSIYRTTERGVSPLLNWLDSGTDMMGYSVADKVVGKAAALLYCLLGVRRVYGRVMSVSAVKVFRANGIEYSWSTLTETVLNRRKNGSCPMELATANYDEPEDALPIIRQTLQNLQTQ